MKQTGRCPLPQQKGCEKCRLIVDAEQVVLGLAARPARFGSSRAMHAGGVAEISRWQAPKGAPPPDPSGILTSTPAGSRTALRHPAGVRYCGDHDPVAARLRRLPPANFQHASGVPSAGE